MAQTAILPFIVAPPLVTVASFDPPSPATRTRTSPWRSEIRLLRDRHVVVEQVLVIFGADELGQRPLSALVALVGLPRPVERIGIVYRDVHFQHVAAIDQVPALHHMELLGLRCAEGI